ncbi:uncharacterized protein LOC116771484 [Danaus plexippus]|uniref:uncharacterized protein LOC116771484 n=1 Tax=Danaus plexippus TaxID=13037 RepID=UPI002AB09B80|nr:uncharacterized protein LOC116771484 [Danaus plexippus]
MYRNFYIVLLTMIFTSVRAFFLYGEKEPLLFCIKVCPLYCSPRRRDDDASSLIYVDDPPYIEHHSYHHEIPYHFDPYYFCKPKTTTTTTTTTPAPTTTTEEPTWICMVCKTKCSKYPVKY